MKKTISLIISSVLLLTALVLPVRAGDAYPESEHNYKTDVRETWEYTYPEAVAGLYVTFDERTFFNDEEWVRYSLTDEDLEELDEERLQFFIENGFLYQDADYLIIYYIDETGREIYYNAYTSSDLAGVTLYIPGRSFRLELYSGAIGTGWGFAVTDVTGVIPDGLALANYHVEDRDYPVAVPVGEPITLDVNFMHRQYGDRMLIGWSTEDGGSWNYRAGDWDHPLTETDIIARDGEVYDFYPVYCPIGLRSEEVYSFTNGDGAFEGGYYYKNGHYYRNVGNWIATYGLTPFMPAAAAGTVFFTVYWPTFEYHGSCCGFPVTELLQHYGKIDLLSTQGVSSLSELEPTDEPISTINVYNNNCVPCHLVNNVAIEPGSEAYTEQLKKLYATVEKGTPVYFEYYPGGNEHPLNILATSKSIGEIDERFDDAHGILITGAYTDVDGRHVLISCDCNSTSYSQGRCDILTIDPDFTEITYGFVLNGFSWNDDVSQFDSFRLEGVSNPFAWHIAFFRHFVDMFRQIFALMFGKK